MNWNLKNRMLVPAVALLVVVMSGLVALSIWTSREALNRALDAQLTALADSTLEQVEQWLSAQQANVSLWAAQPENLTALGSLRSAEKARRVLNEQFARAATTHECFEQIQIADLKGETIASSHPDYIGKINVADRPYFQEALAGRTVVSDALTSKMSGHPIVVIAAPILDRAEVRGVLYAVVDLNWFSAKIIGRIKLLQTGYACLFDHQGRLLAHPDATKLLRTSLGDYDWGREVLARRTGLIDYTIDGVAKHAAVKIGERRGWGVLVTVTQSEVDAPFFRLCKISALLSLGAVLAGATITFLLARSVSNPIQRIASRLATGAEQVTGAAHEISDTSQALAAGASEQAAALEQSSSSLEMLSAGTKRNAESAVQVSALAKQAREAADHGATDMRAMNQAINEIKASSHEVGEIIKTIDEIAFQTNILALNAAVEAARAGEAGAGFAVVAEEVRQLAQRAAQAAGDTTAKIQTAIARTTQGVELDRKVAQAFADIANRTRAVEELAASVATASREQAQSVAEVSTAVRQMDEVVQKNAASAEEAASAAEEMNAQAEVVRASVVELLQLVDGAGRGAAIRDVGTETAQSLGVAPTPTTATEREADRSPTEGPGARRVSESVAKS